MSSPPWTGFLALQATLAIALLSRQDCGAQAFKLVANINADQSGIAARSSTPEHLTRCGAVVLFAAADWNRGTELWATDGRPGGTRLLADIHPFGSSRPDSFVLDGTRIWFVADDAAHGRELWVSDGTTAGTRLVADVVPGVMSADPRALTVFAGRVVFLADDGVVGLEPWISDGTAAGTRLLRDVLPGPEGSSARDLVAAGPYVYFVANDGSRGHELWRTDGTATTLFVDLEPAGSSSPRLLRFDPLSRLLYLTATTVAAGSELWRSDGSPAGTSVLDLSPGAASTWITSACVAGGRLFFAAASPGQRAELWRSDGTAAGTGIVRPSNAGGPASPTDLTAVGNRAFFMGWTPAAGSEPWCTDGTAAGTTMLVDTLPGAGTASLRSAATDGREIYFAVGGSPASLWRSDLTPGGTRSLGVVAAESIALRSGGGIVFQGNDAAGRELWASDGTAAGTARLLDLAPTAVDHGSAPGALLSLGSFLLFRARDPLRGSGLWRTDGSERGTQLVAATAFEPVLHGAAGGQAYFSAGYALYATDGTAAGTPMLNPAAVQVTGVSVVGPKRLVFGGYDAATGTEPWISDGTPGGTRMLADLTPGRGDTFFWRAIAVDDRAFAFLTYVPESSATLWWSDGTAAGTRAVQTLPTMSLIGGQLRATLGRVFFTPIEQRQGELWVSDGTAGGTFVLHAGGYRHFATADAFWFVDTAGALWRSDGTRAGTRAVLALAGSTGPVAEFGGRLVLREVRQSPRESFPRETVLWTSDGTAAGTRVLARFLGNAAVTPLGANRLLVVASSATTIGGWHHGLWTVDAGGAVRSVGNVRREPFGVECAAVNGRLVFTHDDGVHGDELWGWDPGALALATPTGCTGGGRRAQLRCDDPRLGQPLTVSGGAVPPSAAVALCLGRPAFPMLRAGACSFAGLPEIVLAAFVPAAPDWVRSLAIPNQPYLLGASAVLQAVWGPVLSGVDVTNGMLLTFGW